jgi:hypothetical protein
VTDLRGRAARLGRWWRDVAWWRAVALSYAVVAVTCAAQILTSSVTYWRPCFGSDYDSPACLRIQSHEASSAMYTGITTQWLVATVTALAAAALCAWAGAPRRVVLAVPLLPVLVNPVADYFLTPLMNGFYTSYDLHPGSGIPMGAAIAISGVVAAVGALTVGGGRRPG